MGTPWSWDVFSWRLKAHLLNHCRGRNHIIWCHSLAWSLSGIHSPCSPPFSDSFHKKVVGTQPALPSLGGVQLWIFWFCLKWNGQICYFFYFLTHVYCKIKLLLNQTRYILVRFLFNKFNWPICQIAFKIGRNYTLATRCDLDLILIQGWSRLIMKKKQTKQEENRFWHKTSTLVICTIRECKVGLFKQQKDLGSIFPCAQIK